MGSRRWGEEVCSPHHPLTHLRARELRQQVTFPNARDDGLFARGWLRLSAPGWRIVQCVWNTPLSASVMSPDPRYKRFACA